MDLLPSLSGFLSEIILCGVILLLILLDVCGLKKIIFYVAIAGVVIKLFLPGDIIQIIMALAAIITIFLSGAHQRMEFYVLILSVLLGADILTITDKYVMIILAMEMISLSSYVLTTGLNADKKRAEAAWKFFIYGSVATAVMIFGMTYMYGAENNALLSNYNVGSVSTIGMFMMLCGFLFKMTAMPFHLWAPDVYESAPTPVVAYLSVVPKLAAVMIVSRWASTYNQDTVLAIAAILSIAVGTLAALNQSNAKRMMAYSSIAQAGFILAAISGNQPEPLLFYLVVFAIMNYVVFTGIHVQEQSGHGTAFDDFKGIGYASTLPSVALTLGLISLVGLPPMAGFMAKLFVFTAIWQKFSDSQNPVFLILFIAGLIATAASLYFYLKIPFYAFFRRDEEKQPIKIPVFTNLLLLILVALLLALFLAPGLLMG